MTHTLGWRSIFFVSATLGTIGFAASRLILQEETTHADSQREPFDWAGALAFALGISSFLLAITTGHGGLWGSITVWGEFAVALTALGFFIWWEGRSRYPLLDLKLFRISTFTTGNLARLASFITINMNNLTMPFFLQLGLALDPLKAGLMMIPTSIALALLSPVTGWLSDRVGAKFLASAGLAVMGSAFFSLSLIRLGTSPVAVVIWLSLLGIGLGFFQTPNNNSLMSSIPHGRLGVGSSFLAIIRSLGQSVGVALSVTIISGRLLAMTGQTSLQSLRGSAGLEVESVLMSAFMAGYHIIYITAGILCLAGALASIMRVR